MSLPAQPISSLSIADASRCQILESRNQYRSCHIRVPDAKERLAAILVNYRYYSYFRLVKESHKTLQLAAKLIQRGDEVAITRTAKGDVIWIYEPEAKADPLSTPSTPPQNPHLAVSSPYLWKLLDEPEYRLCQIRVPDVAKPMMAIYNDRCYYSLFRTMREQTQAIDLAERLAQKGQAARITRNNQAWSIWVLESESSVYA